jgi:hypothetical protein
VDAGGRQATAGAGKVPMRPSRVQGSMGAGQPGGTKAAEQGAGRHKRRSDGRRRGGQARAGRRAARRSAGGGQQQLGRSAPVGALRKQP